MNLLLLGQPETLARVGVPASVRAGRVTWDELEPGMPMSPVREVLDGWGRVGFQPQGLQAWAMSVHSTALVGFALDLKDGSRPHADEVFRSQWVVVALLASGEDPRRLLAALSLLVKPDQPNGHVTARHADGSPNHRVVTHKVRRVLIAENRAIDPGSELARAVEVRIGIPGIDPDILCDALCELPACFAGTYGHRGTIPIGPGPLGPATGVCPG